MIGRIACLTVALSLLLASVVGADPATPVLSGSIPSVVRSDATGAVWITLLGSNLEPPAIAFGVSQFEFNSRMYRYEDVKIRIVTTGGAVGPEYTCSAGNNSISSTGCGVASSGPDSIRIQVDPYVIPDWKTAAGLQARVHLMLPAAGGTTELYSNTYIVPFARPFDGKPAITNLSPVSFRSDATAWSVAVDATSVDRTAIVRIDSGPVVTAPPKIFGSTGSFATVLSEKLRATGIHSVQVCRVVPIDPAPSTSLVCSDPRTIAITPTVKRVDGPVGAVGVASATDLVTVTCERATLFADRRGTPLGSGGRPVVARAGMTFYAFRDTFDGPSGPLRSLDLGAPVFLLASCLK